MHTAEQDRDHSNAEFRSGKEGEPGDCHGWREGEGTGHV